MTDKIVVLSTCATAKDAERMACALITSHLAACVNVVPQIRSYYRWKGELESAAEFLLIIKSSRDLFDALKLELEKLHPYEVPEVLAIPIVAGAENYLNWLGHNLRGGDGE
ncbi:MAG: CutA1 divalent ion tolerance protein [Candidatus Solibacter sp.]|nr:CutA1 divalent ion tolerance protein [Candidatus Solibacter sp.]